MSQPISVARSLSPGGLRRQHATPAFVTFFLLSIGLLNLPGTKVYQVDVLSDGKYGSHFPTRTFCEHGWPSAFVRRDAIALDDWPYYRLSSWRIWEGIDEFKPIRLISNILLIAVVTWVARGLLHKLRRRGVWRYKIRHVVVLVGIITASVAAVYLLNRAQYRKQLCILQVIDSIEERTDDGRWDTGEHVEWQLGGPILLRGLICDKPFAVFDRVVGIDTMGGDAVDHIAKLASIKVVRIAGKVSNRQLGQLTDLPQLEALDLSFCSVDCEGQEFARAGSDGPAESWLRLPPLPHLRGLNLYGTTFRGDGLENIPSIESLDLTKTDIGDGSVATLAALHSLRKLVLYDTALSEAAIEHVRQALPNCEVVPRRIGAEGGRGEPEGRRDGERGKPRGE